MTEILKMGIHFCNNWGCKIEVQQSFTNIIYFRLHGAVTTVSEATVVILLVKNFVVKGHPHLAILPAILLGVDACISRSFRTCCLKLAQCGWVSNTIASNIAGNIAKCGCPFTCFQFSSIYFLCVTFKLRSTIILSFILLYYGTSFGVIWYFSSMGSIFSLR